MKRLLIPLFGAALVTAALVAAPEKPESCEPCDPAECCPDRGQNCCRPN